MFAAGGAGPALGYWEGDGTFHPSLLNFLTAYRMARPKILVLAQSLSLVAAGPGWTLVQSNASGPSRTATDLRVKQPRSPLRACYARFPLPRPTAAAPHYGCSLPPPRTAPRPLLIALSPSFLKHATMSLLSVAVPASPHETVNTAAPPRDKAQQPQLGQASPAGPPPAAESEGDTAGPFIPDLSSAPCSIRRALVRDISEKRMWSVAWSIFKNSYH